MKEFAINAHKQNNNTSNAAYAIYYSSIVYMYCWVYRLNLAQPKLIVYANSIDHMGLSLFVSISIQPSVKVCKVRSCKSSGHSIWQTMLEKSKRRKLR